MNAWDVRDKAKSLRKSKKYKEALPLFESLWKEHADVWDGWGYAHCLFHLGRTPEALDVTRAVYKSEPDFDQNCNLYAWCIYRLEINIDPVRNIATFLKAGAAILNLAHQDDRYAPYFSTVVKVSRELLRRDRAEDALTWLNRLKPDLLSKQPESFTDRSGKRRTTPSEMQRFLILKAKAFHKLEQHQECIKTVNQALQSQTELVNDADIWLKRLRALSLGASGNPDQAFTELEQLLHKKQDWFFHADLLRFADQKGDRPLAWKHALNALLKPGPLEMKINVLEQTVSWLVEEGQTNEAKATMALVLAIRKKHEWNIPPEIQAQSDALGVTEDDHVSTKPLLKTLQKQWRTRLEAFEPRLQGTIKTILPNARAGFVQATGGKDYFFLIRDLQGTKPKVGLKVSFRTVAGYDRKKDQQTINATDLKPL